MTVLLGGCATNPFKRPPSDVVVQVQCPAIQKYDAAQLAKASKEFDTLPQGSALKSMFGDYQNLRDQTRACRRQPLEGNKK
jgi:hypothetical protein